MVQAFSVVVEDVVEATAGDPGGSITKLNQPNGWNDASPGITATYPRPWSAGSLLWHSKIWKDIFGASHSHPNPARPTQAQTNQLISQALGNLLVLIATVTDGANAAIQELHTQVTTDVPDIIGLVGSDVAGLAQQIAALRAAIGTGNAGAIQQAVSQSEAYTRSQVAALSKGLGTELNTITHELQHEANLRISGDRQTLAQAEAFTSAAVATEAARRYAADQQLAATERSDVLNLGSRIESVRTTLEGDIARAAQAEQGFATNLVNGLNVPGLRSDVSNLTDQVAKLATETDECLTPLCDTVTPNAPQLGKLGNLLKGLEGLGIAALLASLVTTAIADPVDSARAIVDVAGWVPGVGAELVQAVT